MVPAEPRYMTARKPQKSPARSRGKAPVRTDGADAAPKTQLRAQKASLCVVGIGASAGGFDAISEFLRAMPAGSGLAFVVLQHLSPTQKSLSAELFAKRTAMEVVEAAHGARVQANRVYTIPADVYASIENGALRFERPSDPRGRRLPIAHFFRSLGEDQKERAIGIVFSGTGSDGTLGLKHIIANGGIVLVQSPETAQFDGMPRSAIATSLVTHVLPVSKMPEAVLAYARHPYTAAPREAMAAAGSEAAALRVILDHMRAQHGYNFDGYKHRMLLRRIHRRMGVRRIERMGDYAALLRKEPREGDLLFKDLLIGVTEFFRDPEAWKVLEAEVIEPLVAAKTSGEPIRVWVAGAATGEEAYSIAMLLLEKLEEANKACPLQVFATDTNDAALDFARAGLYSAGIAEQVPAKRLARYFVEIKDDHHYQVVKPLRECVVFGLQNLFADPPFSRVDLVACRNLLIYLEPDVQRRVIPLFHFALKPGGYLFLGSAETVAQREDLFRSVSRKWHIYQRIGGSPHEHLDWRAAPGESRAAAPAPVARRVPAVPAQAAAVAQQTLLEHFAPASVLVNARLEVLYFTGRVDRYLLQPRGAPTQDLLALAREGLRSQLRQAIRKALESDETVEVPGSRVKRDEAFVPVRITVAPTGGADASGRLLLVVFREEPRARTGRPTRAKEAALVHQLEEELRITKDDLQNSIERLQSSNEELRVANEEVVSINEELQSLNEELESSKEELQSLNEELNTVNQQLQSKITELEGANNDLKNLLDSSDVATICLDRDLKIKWFTPATRGILNVLQGDVGRSIGELASPLLGESLMREAHTVLERLAPVHQDVEAEPGRWFVRRVLPYRTEDQRIEGVTVTYTDITESRRSADAAIAARKAMTASLEERVRERTVQVRALAAELALAEERERQAIARDLHDDLGQVLNIAKLKVDTLLKSCTDEVNKAPLADLAELVGQADRNVRTLTFQISPPVLSELGLGPALQWLAEEMQRTHGLAVELRDDGRDKPLSQPARSIVFRAVRELLINVSKHAKVHRAQVGTSRKDGSLTITVSDAGVGFDPALVLGGAPPGFGLLSVRERLSFIGGEAEITSVPGDGTVVTLTVPLQTGGQAAT
jgi:two-component system CheB/CheR fusion protein